ncbi:IS701 family transposase [Streptomyces albidoflavus]
MITESAAAQWDLELDDLFLAIGHRFGQVELRRRMRDYVRGLLAPVARKNSWQLAEQAGHSTPDGLQHLLAGSKWEPDDIRDDLQEYVAAKLGDADGVLIIDDTGFIKKGTTSAGVQRQYSGTAGRTENCQIGVFNQPDGVTHAPARMGITPSSREGPKASNAGQPARLDSPSVIGTATSGNCEFRLPVGILVLAHEKLAHSRGRGGKRHALAGRSPEPTA